MTIRQTDQCPKCFRFHEPGIACPYPTSWNVPDHLIDHKPQRTRPRLEIEHHLAELERRLGDPNLRKSAIPILVARIEELNWVLGDDNIDTGATND